MSAMAVFVAFKPVIKININKESKHDNVKHIRCWRASSKHGLEIQLREGTGSLLPCWERRRGCIYNIRFCNLYCEKILWALVGTVTFLPLFLTKFQRPKYSQNIFLSLPWIHTVILKMLGNKFTCSPGLDSIFFGLHLFWGQLLQEGLRWQVGATGASHCSSLVRGTAPSISSMHLLQFISCYLKASL